VDKTDVRMTLGAMPTMGEEVTNERP
jgi:hypothetical protein